MNVKRGRGLSISWAATAWTSMAFGRLLKVIPRTKLKKVLRMKRLNRRRKRRKRHLLKKGREMKTRRLRLRRTVEARREKPLPTLLKARRRKRRKVQQSNQDPVDPKAFPKILIFII